MLLLNLRNWKANRTAHQFPSKREPTIKSLSLLQTKAFLTISRSNFSYLLGKTKKTSASVDGEEVIGKHKGNDGHQLHEDVEGGSRGILEGITYGVTNHSSLVAVRALTAKEGIDVALDVLLGVIPSTSSIGHGDGKLHSRKETPGEEAVHGVHTEESSGDEGGKHHEGARGDHLFESRLGGDLHASLVVGAEGGVLVEELGGLEELSLYFVHHLHSSLSHRLHGHGREPVGKHGADQEEGEGQGVKDLHADGGIFVGVDLGLANTDNESSIQGERHESGRTDGESLTDSGSGVSGSVKGIGLVADLLRELGHLGDSTGIVTDRAVSIDSETSGKVSKHTHSSQGNSVEIAELESNVHNKGQDEHGHDDRLVSEGETVDNVGSGAGLAGVGELDDGLVFLGGVVLGSESDHKSTDSASNDTDEGVVRGGLDDAVHTVNDKGIGKHVAAKEVHGGDHKHSGHDDLETKGELDLVLGGHGVDVGGQKRGHKAHDNTDGRDSDRVAHGAPSGIAEFVGLGSDDKGSAGRLGERSEKIGTHTGNITDVVSHIVGNGGGVTGVVLGNSVNDFTNKIGTNISSFGVDSTTHSAEHSDGRSSETISRNASHHNVPVLLVEASVEQHEGNVENEDAKSGKGESHNRTGAESSIKALLVSIFLGIDSGTHIREHGNLHSNVSRSDGSDGSEDE
mmetsp:Transcript_68411/g.147627  ORF Transcript_68411/g.147627 Transcript_68411/m.147627 type:complete len:684 (-) Transcript_68411:348-2399(-)